MNRTSTTGEQRVKTRRIPTARRLTQANRVRRALALVAAAVVALGVGLPASAGTVTTAHAASYEPITGSGSSWSANAIKQWQRNVAGLYSMQVNYSDTGSSAGRRDFIGSQNGPTVDFAVSEIPFQARPEDGSAPEKPNIKYAYMPIVAGGTAFMYNLKINGQRVTNLRLSGETITKIFTGEITKWNHKQIQSDNPGLKMPNKNIVPVVRSDGSGSTAQFTLWMSKQHKSLWKKFYPAGGLTSQYPVFSGAKGQTGSSGVSGYVAQDHGEGAITYVEYSYALKANFPVAKVLNKSGYYVEPTKYAVAVALMKAKINNNKSSSDYLTQILDGVYSNNDKRSYPLSSYSYLIVPTEAKGIVTNAKGKTLAEFGKYLLCEGQQQAGDLGYSPLPMNLVQAGFTQIKRIPGAGSVKVDINKCNNPTFKAGDSLSKNQLAQTAPMPQECDKKGPEQCTTGTGGAEGSTPKTGNGGGDGSGGGDDTGGSGTDDTGGSGTDDTGSAGTDDTGSAGVVIDDNGELVSAGSAGNAAVASPFTLPEDGWGGTQTMMVVAGLLLLAAMLVPPMLGNRMGSSSRKGGEQ
ncbi:phosphate ABC transporter substrate-binding protein PstS [Leucobacter weissii]|uniref:Phosphate ABC transporter substrate-binding protein PstS n=1 Tax=Leucobacter weissii TaxID=1983706 RepID=A0A939SBB6_9MICO|nr:phosphate ABC transporter substrate-binding protein PstS [Leucobacter weissii]MBO1902832.1 phosphate ABC transporter substrate-binding protein PstS [Leucobacter weissii]